MTHPLRPKYLENHNLFPRKIITPSPSDMLTIRTALWTAWEEYCRLADSATCSAARDTWQRHRDEVRKLIHKAFGE